MKIELNFLFYEEVIENKMISRIKIITQFFNVNFNLEKKFNINFLDIE